MFERFNIVYSRVRSSVVFWKLKRWFQERTEIHSFIHWMLLSNVQVIIDLFLNRTRNFCLISPFLFFHSAHFCWSIPHNFDENHSGINIYLKCSMHCIPMNFYIAALIRNESESEINLQTYLWQADNNSILICLFYYNKKNTSHSLKCDAHNLKQVYDKIDEPTNDSKSMRKRNKSVIKQRKAKK